MVMFHVSGTASRAALRTSGLKHLFRAVALGFPRSMIGDRVGITSRHCLPISPHGPMCWPPLSGGSGTNTSPFPRNSFCMTARRLRFSWDTGDRWTSISSAKGRSIRWLRLRRPLAHSGALSRPVWHLGRIDAPALADDADPGSGAAASCASACRGIRQGGRQARGSLIARRAFRISNRGSRL